MNTVENSPEYIYLTLSSFLRDKELTIDNFGHHYKEHILSDSEVEVANRFFSQYHLAPVDKIDVVWETNVNRHTPNDLSLPTYEMIDVVTASGDIHIMYGFEKNTDSSVTSTKSIFVDNDTFGLASLSPRERHTEKIMEQVESEMVIIDVGEYFAISALASFLAHNRQA